MIFALGTPINVKFKPWVISGMLKPDALMISVVDFLRSSKLYRKVLKRGIRDVLEWDGLIVCDSGAFTAINSKKRVKLTVKTVKTIYREFFSEDDSIIKISLDFPTEAIFENYKELEPLNVHPAIPHDRMDILEEIINYKDDQEWIFIGRLVPLMRSGRNQLDRLKNRMDVIKSVMLSFYSEKTRPKLWTLGLGAPSFLEYLIKSVDGADSSRWRVSGSNMIMLPSGGERGVGNRTKWMATHKRIQNGEEKMQVLKILREIYDGCDALFKHVTRLSKLEHVTVEWLDGASQELRQ